MSAINDELPEELANLFNNHIKDITSEINKLNRQIKQLENERDNNLKIIKTLYNELTTQINDSIEAQSDIHIVVQGSCLSDMTKRSIKSWKKYNPTRWLVTEYVIGILQQKGFEPSVEISDYTTGYCCGRKTYNGGKKLIITCSINF